MSGPIAPTGTHRAASVALLADLDAAVKRYRDTIAPFASEEMNDVELVAVTGTHIAIARAAEMLAELARTELVTTFALRQEAGIPVSETELRSGCNCKHCREALASGKSALH